MLGGSQGYLINSMIQKEILKKIKPISFNFSNRSSGIDLKVYVPPSYNTHAARNTLNLGSMRYQDVSRLFVKVIANLVVNWLTGAKAKLFTSSLFWKQSILFMDRVCNTRKFLKKNRNKIGFGISNFGCNMADY